MRTLSCEEVAAVSGGRSIVGIVGAVLGTMAGAGARVQKYIDGLDNPMLGAMQYGA